MVITVDEPPTPWQPSPDISSDFVVRFTIRNLAGDGEGFLTEATSKQVVAGKNSSPSPERSAQIDEAEIATEI